VKCRPLQPSPLDLLSQFGYRKLFGHRSKSLAVAVPGTARVMKLDSLRIAQRCC
jgi:hypothetical protein